MEVDTNVRANHINEHMEATDTNSNGLLPDETRKEPLTLTEETEIVIEGRLDAGDKVPDGGWGWWIVLGSVIMHMLMGGFERSTGLFYQQFLTRFNGSATATAWVTSIFSTLRLILGPVVSALCTRFSCRSTVIAGGILTLVSQVLSGFSEGLGFLYFSFGFLGGIGRALTYTPSLVIVGYYFNKRRGLAVGLATSGVGFGTFMMPPLIEILFNNYGFQGALMILGSISLNFCISGALFRPLELQHKIQRHEMKKKDKQILDETEVNKQLINGTAIGNGHHKSEQLLPNQSASKLTSSMDITAAMKIDSRRPSLFMRKWNTFRKSFQGSAPKQNKKPFIELSLLKNFTFLALCLAIMMFTIAFNSTFVFLPPLANERGISKIEGAYLVSVLGVSDGLARITMSVILDLKKVKPYRLYVYNVVVFLTGAVSLAYPAMQTFSDFVIMSCLYGILSGTYISQKSVVIVDILGIEKLSSSFGLLLMFQGLGCFIGPPVGGLIKDYVGTYDGAFYVGSAGTFLGGIILLFGNIWRYRQMKKETMSHKQ